MEGNTAGIPPGGIAKRKAAGSCGKGRADREQRAGGGGRGQQAQDQAGAAGAGGGPARSVHGADSTRSLGVPNNRLLQRRGCLKCKARLSAEREGERRRRWGEIFKEVDFVFFSLFFWGFFLVEGEW